MTGEGFFLPVALTYKDNKMAATYFDTLIEKSDYFQSLVFCDLKGKIFATNTVDKKGQIIDYQTMFNKDFPYFEEIPRNSLAIIRKPEFVINNINFGNIAITIPVQDRDSKVLLGVFIAFLNWNKIIEILENEVGNLQKMGFPSASIIIIDKKTNKILSIASDQIKDSLVISKKKLNDLNLSFNYNKINWRGVQRHVVFSSEQFSLITIVSESDLIKAARTMLLVTSIVLGITIILLIISIFFVSMGIAKPIILLANKAKEFGDGDYDAEIKVESKDEIGQLSQVINNTREKIKIFVNELEEAKKEAETANEVKTQFLANVTHELKTPLNGIMGIVDNILDGTDGQVNEKIEKHLKMVFTSAKSLLNLVTDVLSFSRQELGKMKLDIQPFDIRDVITNAVENISTLAEDKSIKVKTEIDDAIKIVWGDVNQITSIFKNILGNAIKFTDTGVINISVKLLKEDYILVSIKDTGIGIKKEDISVIFDKFRQVEGKTSRKYGGTGLGLAIAREIIELHTGTIWAESELGQGTMMNFTLPVKEFQMPEQKKAVDKTIAKSTETKMRVNVEGVKPTVFIINNDEDNIVKTKDLMESKGFEVILASTANEAIEKIATVEPDIFMIDVELPTMNGFELAKKIKSINKFVNSPIMFTTSQKEIDKLTHIAEEKVSQALPKIRKSIETLEDYSLKTLNTADMIKKGDYIIKGENQKIMIIDDNEVNVEVLATLLHNKNYQVETAFSGNEGLEKIKENAPDLILLDVMMPEMDGFEFIKILKSKPEYNYCTDIPIIMVTAKGTQEDKLQGLSTGADDYLPKPYDKKELLAKVSIFLRLHTLQSELKQWNVTLEEKVQDRTSQLELLNQELKKAKEMAEAASEFKTQFLANVTHDLRTPLHVILGLNEALQKHEYVKQHEDLKEPVDIVKLNARKLLTLVNDLLDLNKIKSGKITVNNSIFYFKDLLMGINELAATMIKNKEVKFVLDNEIDSEMVIESDFEKLHQVITNLISNAIKFTNKGFINLKSYIEKDRIYFEVKDTGIGIKKEDLGRIFEAYDQVYSKEALSTYKGTGLGLSICKEFIKLLKGGITAESEPQKGAKFQFWVPLKTSAKKLLETKEEKSKTDFTIFKDKSILFCDDDEFNIYIGRMILKDVVDKVTFVTNGKEAIKACEKEKFDIILLDYNMPGLNGQETLKEIKKIKLNEATDIAVVSALIDDINKDKLLGFGFNHLLPKPFTEDALLTFLYNVFKNKH
ncbi:response regulator [Candidatus Margulisiibacteriota bacterium]